MDNFLVLVDFVVRGFLGFLGGLRIEDIRVIFVVFIWSCGLDNYSFIFKYII